MARLTRRQELEQLFRECLPATGYFIFAGILDQDARRIQWNYIRRDFHDDDVRQAVDKLAAMADQELKGGLMDLGKDEPEKGGGEGGEKKEGEA